MSKVFILLAGKLRITVHCQRTDDYDRFVSLMFVCSFVIASRGPAYSRDQR